CSAGRMLRLAGELSPEVCLPHGRRGPRVEESPPHSVIALCRTGDDPAGLAVAEKADAGWIDSGHGREGTGLGLWGPGEHVDARGGGVSGVAPAGLSDPSLVIREHGEAVELEVGREDVELVARPRPSAVNHRDRRKRAWASR